MFDYRCSRGHVHEAFVEPGVEERPCPKCKRPAMRMIPAPRAQLEGFTGDFPGAADKWVRMRESKMAQERKQMASNGEVNGNPLPKWRESKIVSAE